MDLHLHCSEILCITAETYCDMKSGIVRPEEIAFARQWHSKHFFMAMNAHATSEELLGRC
jgi:hypothetical protein